MTRGLDRCFWSVEQWFATLGEGTSIRTEKPKLKFLRLLSFLGYQSLTQKLRFVCYSHRLSSSIWRSAQEPLYCKLHTIIPFQMAWRKWRSNWYLGLWFICICFGIGIGIGIAHVATSNQNSKCKNQRKYDWILNFSIIFFSESHFNKKFSSMFILGVNPYYTLDYH